MHNRSKKTKRQIQENNKNTKRNYISSISYNNYYDNDFINSNNWCSIGRKWLNWPSRKRKKRAEDMANEEEKEMQDLLQEHSNLMSTYSEKTEP